MNNFKTSFDEGFATNNLETNHAEETMRKLQKNLEPHTKKLEESIKAIQKQMELLNVSNETMRSSPVVTPAVRPPALGFDERAKEFFKERLDYIVNRAAPVLREICPEVVDDISRRSVDDDAANNFVLWEVIDKLIQHYEKKDEYDTDSKRKKTTTSLYQSMIGAGATDGESGIIRAVYGESDLTRALRIGMGEGMVTPIRDAEVVIEDDAVIVEADDETTTDKKVAKIQSLLLQLRENVAQEEIDPVALNIALDKMIQRLQGGEAARDGVLHFSYGTATRQEDMLTDHLVQLLNTGDNHLVRSSKEPFGGNRVLLDF